MNNLHWLLTSTTYGTWLPGDPRGFVGRVRDYRDEDSNPSQRIEHDGHGTDYDRGLAGLLRASAERQKHETVWLTAEQAQVVLEQFQQTATHRNWQLHAAAIMTNHFHIVASSPDAVLGETLLRDFKSYASRALNKQWPRVGTWWTQSGSRRILPNEDALQNAIRYVLNQPQPLARCPI